MALVYLIYIPNKCENPDQHSNFQHLNLIFLYEKTLLNRQMDTIIIFQIK